MPFDTQLSEENERRFQKWLVSESKRRNRDVSMDLENYDLRGYWVNGGYKDTTGNGHMPDTYKKPNHITFSTESMYHGADIGNGEKAEGGVWQGDSAFVPSRFNLNSHGLESMKWYFKKYEPGVKLVY